MALASDYMEDLVSQLEDVNKRLSEQLRNATKKHHETVEDLEELLTLALRCANMTRQQLQELKEKEDDKALDESGWDMARGCRGCI